MMGKANRARLVRRLALATALAAVGVTALATAGFGQLGGEPITANRYSLTVDGVEIGTFGELSGMTQEVDPVGYWQATNPNRLAKIKPPVLTLKRGMTSAMELWSWYQQVILGRVAQARRNVTLVMFNDEGEPVARYLLAKAWPTKLELGALKAGSSEALTETVTLTADSIQRVAP